jgi:hypothetical protein
MAKIQRLGHIPQELEWLTQIPSSEDETKSIPLQPNAQEAIKDSTINQYQALLKYYQGKCNELEGAINKQNSHTTKDGAQKGLARGWIRRTFIVQEKHIPKLQAIAYERQTTIKNIIDQALTDLFNKC